MRENIRITVLEMVILDHTKNPKFQTHISILIGNSISIGHGCVESFNASMAPDIRVDFSIGVDLEAGVFIIKTIFRYMYIPHPRLVSKVELRIPLLNHQTRSLRNINMGLYFD